MIIAHVEVSGVSATCKRRSRIPARLVGGQVAIEYADPVWVGLNKTAVFRGSVTKDVLNVDNTVVIPPEVVAKAGADLHFGIEGRSADGTLVIPLIEAYLGTVSVATNPSGDASTDPSLQVWQQILGLIGDLDDLTTEAKNTLVAAINEAAGKGGGTVDEETVWEIVESYLQENPPQVDVPVKVSQLENDSGFVDRLVSDLQNYYLKSQTYTRSEIDGKLSAIPKFSIKAVNSLPTTDISGTTVYLLSTGSGSDLYTEYIYVNGEWEVLGSQRVDLTGYATEDWATGMFQPKGSYLTKVPDGYAKTEDVPRKPEDIGAQPAGNYLTEVPKGYVKSVNGETPDDDGNVEIDIRDSGGFVAQDTAPEDTSVLWIDTGDDSKDVLPGGPAGSGDGGEPMPKILSYTVGEGEALNGINIALKGNGYKEVYVWVRSFTITKDGAEVTAATSTRISSTKPTNLSMNLTGDVGNSCGASQGTNIGAREITYYGKIMENGAIMSVASSNVLNMGSYAIVRPYPDAFTEFRDLRIWCVSGHYYTTGTEVEVYAK